MDRTGGPLTGASREAIVATAGESMARGSRSFALASRLFDRTTRERAWLLYAWCRRCDDLADGQDHGGAMTAVGDPAGRIAYMTDMTERVLAGEIVGDPAFDALGFVARECAIPHHLLRDHIRGFAMDAADWRPRSEADLLSYCYHVAGSIGVGMAQIMGVPGDAEDALDRACDLGIAFQLANIARDIEEDDRAGRCYLPLEWLVELDIPPGEQMKPQFRPRLAVMAKWLVEMVAEYEDSARRGARALRFRSAWAVLAAAGIYDDIARDVAARGEHAWDHRVTTPLWRKLWWVWRGFWQAQARGARYRAVPRPPGLWTRPREQER